MGSVSAELGTVRELAFRTSQGIGEMSVRLWWIEGTKDVGYDLIDDGVVSMDENGNIRAQGRVNYSRLVPPEEAMRAFNSPHGYRTQEIPDD